LKVDKNMVVETRGKICPKQEGLYLAIDERNDPESTTNSRQWEGETEYLGSNLRITETKWRGGLPCTAAQKYSYIASDTAQHTTR